MERQSSLSVLERGTVFISTRSVAAFIVLLMAAVLGCRLLDAEQPSTAALKVVLPTLAVGLVPGMLATMLWTPRPQLTLLEALGFGAVVSFGVVHLLTIFAIAAHVSTAFVLVLLALASVIAAARILQQSPGSIVLNTDETIVVSLLIGLGTLLFWLGSPVDTFEDQVHVAIVRRLSQLESPNFDNIYFSPGVVYTYPFPGTHYYMALIARLGDIDALFLYHKLRFFWGLAALVMLYLAARAVFGTSAIACAVTSTAVMLVCTGIFGMVPGLSWSQLVPYSHASDVAMTVLLPAMLVTAFGFLQANERRERTFFFTATSTLVLMLTFVHIREVVQFSAYMTCFLAVSLIAAGLRPYAKRATQLLVLVVIVATTYSAWQARMVPYVSSIVDSQRARLVSTFASSSVAELLFEPVPTLLSGLVPHFDLVWNGLTPFFLFVGPPVILLFRRQPLVWLLSSSTFAYLMVMIIPLVAFPYVYLTYFEILYTPVRNVIFFVYLFAGAFLYAIAIGLARIDRTRLSLLIAGGIIGIFALLVTLSINRTGGGFFAPLLVAYGLTFVLAWSWPVITAVKIRGIAIAIVSMLALVVLWPDNPPQPRKTVVNVRWTAGLAATQRTVFERQFGLTNGEPTSSYSDAVNVWSYWLHDLSRQNVEALVRHPDVVDTHHIDRQTFTVPLQPPEADHPFVGVRLVPWLHYPGWALLIGTTLFVWMLGFVVPSMLVSSSGEWAASLLMTGFREPFHKHVFAFALCLVPFAIWSARPTLSLVQPALSLSGTIATPRAMIEHMPCTLLEVAGPSSESLEAPFTVPQGTACPPNYALVEWVKRHVPVDAVFANNRWNPHLPSVFMAQQVVVFSSRQATLIGESQLFERYYQFYDESITKYHAQPFFNDVETARERAAFVDVLGVTHVLVDPAYYDQMRPILDGLPGQYSLEYAQDKWAVYSVIRSASERPTDV